jgi:hypothetical protein
MPATASVTDKTRVVIDLRIGSLLLVTDRPRNRRQSQPS